jgi:hypothetical protein
MSADYFQKRAQDHIARLSRLFTAIAELSPRATLHELARAVKREFQADIDSLRGRRYITLSKEERDAVDAILKARCHLLFKTNSDPVRSRWVDHVGEAQQDLELWLSRKSGQMKP